MSPKKSADFYKEEELAKIKEQWKNDKARIDADMKGEYPRDIDQAYKKCLANAALRALFGHAIYLYWGGIVEGELFLYANEKNLVTDVYREIRKNGYYSRSKTAEKKTRAHLGKSSLKAVLPKIWKEMRSYGLRS